MLDGAHDLAALARGFWTTLRHAAQPPLTLLYPEVKRRLPAAFRGRHRLYRHSQADGGLERCIGCELCAAACPSGAIFVQAADNDPDHPTSTGERYAAVYEINMLRCIFCGYCEEACPVDAIRLGPEYELADFDRQNFVYTKDMLLDPHKFAPARQYHRDVDETDPELHRAIPPEEDLGLVYAGLRPLGAAQPSSAPVVAGEAPVPSGSSEPPSAAPAARATAPAELPGPTDATPAEPTVLAPAAVERPAGDVSAPDPATIERPAHEVRAAPSAAPEPAADEQPEDDPPGGQGRSR